MEIQGKITAVLPERSGVSQKGEWKSQDFVIEYQEGSYIRKMVFTVFGADRLQRFNIQTGQTVSVAFGIDAHEWNGRWFNEVRAYDVRQTDTQQQYQQPASQGSYAPSSVVGTPAPSQNAPVARAAAPQQYQQAAGGDSDSLPF